MPTALLINPNRYRHPPVIPIGLEYLAHSLRSNGIDTHLLDLCFSESPASDIMDAVASLRPDAVCLTVRNVDSVLYPDTEFFLPEIASYVKTIKSITDVPVIIGGAGVSANPKGILEFLGADIAFKGPAEATLPKLMFTGDYERYISKTIRCSLSRGTFVPERGVGVDYNRYISEGGVAGFETHKGCSSKCAYCTESSTQTCFREPADVVSELEWLSSNGYRHLHLCDSEFNENLGFCLEVLRRMLNANLGIRWALYMKPGNYSPELFSQLSKSGAYLVTLSVDTMNRPENYWHEVADMIALTKKARMQIAVDLLTGFPGEKPGTLERTLDFFRNSKPSEVVVNTYLRLYRGIRITKIIEDSPEHMRHVMGNIYGDLLEPSFYNRVSKDTLRSAIGGDPLFRVAGDDKGVNYQFSK